MPKENLQHKLFSNEETPEEWKEEWKGMPEFIQEDKMPYQQIIVSFESKEDVEKFSQLIGKKLTYKTRSLWFPIKERLSPNNFRYVTE